MVSKAAKKPEKISKDAVVAHALLLASELGWEHVTLTDIAQKSDMSLAGLREDFEDKSDILAHLGRIIDKRVLEAMSDAGGGGDVSPRDKLFDVMMERFEALNEFRDGIVAVLHSFRYDPKQAVIACPHLCRSMSWMLEAAGIDTNGISGALRVSGLTGIYIKVLRTWRDDDSPDLGKTMAALDKDLARAEKLAGMLGF